jgi:hypothetical protein
MLSARIKVLRHCLSMDFPESHITQGLQPDGAQEMGDAEAAHWAIIKAIKGFWFRIQKVRKRSG